MLAAGKGLQSQSQPGIRVFIKLPKTNRTADSAIVLPRFTCHVYYAISFYETQSSEMM